VATLNKLSRPSDQRRAILRNQVTALLWNGRIETTQARAREVRRIAEKLLTKAIRTYEDTVTVSKSVKDDNGNVTTQEFVNDGPKKLAARRQLMEYLYDFPLEKGEKESKYQYAKRSNENKHPVVEKMFRELAPKYDQRAKELGQGGGYTRTYKCGPRRGDAAEAVIIELV